MVGFSTMFAAVKLPLLQEYIYTESVSLDNQYITSNNDTKEEKWRQCKFTFLVEFYCIQ